jgi:RNase P protein component
LNTPGLGINIPKQVFANAVKRNTQLLVQAPVTPRPAGRAARLKAQAAALPASIIDVDFIVIDSPGTGKIVNSMCKAHLSF